MLWSNVPILQFLAYNYIAFVNHMIWRLQLETVSLLRQALYLYHRKALIALLQFLLLCY